MYVPCLGHIIAQTCLDAFGHCKKKNSSLHSMSEFSSAKIGIQKADVGINFLLDDTSLVELSDLSDWKQEADQRIRQLRMGDINFQ